MAVALGWVVAAVAAVFVIGAAEHRSGLATVSSETSSSPVDGQVLAFSGGDGIRIMNAAGELLNVVTTGNQDGNLAWSVDGHRIAFQNWDGVWIVNVDGTDLQFLRSGLHPSWSPDGAHVAIQDHDGLFIVSVDGGDTRLVSSSTAQGYPASWSPDGSRLAFVIDDGLAVVDLIDGGLTVLDPGYVARPRWSPDGSLIAYSRCAADVCGIFVVAPDGSLPLALVDGPEALMGNWSPDGTQIAYFDRHDLWVSTLGGVRTLVVQDEHQINDRVTWSPTGQRLAFESGVIEGSIRGELFIVDTDGSNLRRLTDSEVSDFEPTFRPSRVTE